MSNSHPNNESDAEVDLLSKQEDDPALNICNEHKRESMDDTTSSSNFQHEWEQEISSSELDLSTVLQSCDNASSLSLTSLDNQENLATNDDDDDDDDKTSLLTSIEITSDNESVLYSRLSAELNIIEATLDSDLDRIGR